MLFILQLFLCTDRKQSLQRQLLRLSSKGGATYLSLREDYERLLEIAERKKYQKLPLRWEDMVFAAKYYRSFQNEMAGKTVRYDLPDNHDQS